MKKRRPEAPVNGGRNYNGPKVGIAALEKLGYMLGTLSISHYLARGDNVTSADNQQESPLKCRGILRDYTPDPKRGMR